jgi:predicted GNAT family N-acyltransferase
MIANTVITSGRWEDLQQSLIQVRTEVFIEEQHVPTLIEWDALDAGAIHLLALNEDEKAIGCARILNVNAQEGIARVGRMAVLKAWRGCGLGRQLLDKGIALCRQHNVKKIAISSQTHAIKFYQQAGFVVTSDAYIDANIWHVDMALTL